MSRIGFLGLGAMGSRMAANFVAAGHQVTVWNRDGAKSRSLSEAGANVALSPREAAKDSEFVFSMVRDDDASRQIWLDEKSGALGGMMSGATAIECSTLSFDWVCELGARCAAANINFLDAPVAGSRPQADQRQLIFLVGGEEAVIAQAQPLLMTTAAAVHHAGPVGSGAVVKLAVNALFGIQVTALGELIAMIRRLGVDPARAIEILAATPVCSAAAKAAAGSMLAGNFAPMFPIDIVEKDFGYVVAAAGSPDVVPMTATACRVFGEANRKGLGHEHLTAVAKLY